MRLVVFAMLVAAGIVTVGCGAEKIKTVDEARTAIRKIAEGADPGNFKAADDATPAARSVLADKSKVRSLESQLDPGRIGGHGGAACDAAGLAASLGETNEEDGELSVSAVTRARIREEVAQNRGLDPLQASLAVDPILDAIVGMTESSVVEITDKVCSTIEHL